MVATTARPWRLTWAIPTTCRWTREDGSSLRTRDTATCGEWTRTALIRVVAGAGEKWDRGDGGPAIAANLVHVLSVEHGPGGDIYIGDAEAGRIRRIDASTGIIETVAGSGTPGYSGDGGPAVEARVGAPTAIRFDGAGNLYFSDRNHNVVRKSRRRGHNQYNCGHRRQGLLRGRHTRRQGDGCTSPGAWRSRLTGSSTCRTPATTGCAAVGRREARLETVAGGTDAGDFGDGGEAVMQRG